MTTHKLSPQDRKDLDKFTKYLVYKCVQIVVQSRLGEKITTQSKLFSSGTDWFNLSIRDDPDVLSEIRSIYGSSNLMNGQKICLEISLRTEEGEEMILETWYLETTDYCDPTCRVSYSVYSRIGTLLKSLLCITRALPAYKLSRRQGPDCYIMCYRIYLGLPQFNLGDGYVKRTVGLVPTPVGTVTLYVAYRTKLILSPKCNNTDLLMKAFQDNYYHQELHSLPHSKSDLSNAKQEQGHGNGKTATRSLSGSNLSLAGEIARNSCRSGFHGQSDEGTNYKKEESRPGSLPLKPMLGQSCNSCLCNRNMDSTIRKLDTNQDRSILSSEDSKDSELKRSVQPMVVASSSSASNHSSNSAVSAPDDFVILEMKSQFVNDGLDAEELGKFYEECKIAPPLSMFQQSMDLHEMLNSITDQLAQFEANAKDFDEFVNSITDDMD